MSATQWWGSRQAWFLVPLRLMLGFGFAAHGYAKLMRGPENLASTLQALGVPAPHLMSWVTTLIELVGGVMVMAGAFVVPLSVPLIVVMLTAMFTVHLRYGFSTIKLISANASGAKFGPPGYEMNLLYIVGLVTLVLGGPGAFSVDGYRRKARG